MDDQFGPDGLPTAAERQRRLAVYQRLLPRLQLLSWQAGYALIQHGTMTRDLDLVAVPWIEAAAPAGQLIESLKRELGGNAWASAPSSKPHGRLAYSVHFGTYENAHLYLDVSVMPRH